MTFSIFSSFSFSRPQPTTAEASSLHAEFQRELRSLSEKKRSKKCLLLSRFKQYLFIGGGDSVFEVYRWMSRPM